MNLLILVVLTGVFCLSFARLEKQGSVFVQANNPTNLNQDSPSPPHLNKFARTPCFAPVNITNPGQPPFGTLLLKAGQTQSIVVNWCANNPSKSYWSLPNGISLPSVSQSGILGRFYASTQMSSQTPSNYIACYQSTLTIIGSRAGSGNEGGDLGYYTFTVADKFCGTSNAKFYANFLNSNPVPSSNGPPLVRLMKYGQPIIMQFVTCIPALNPNFINRVLWTLPSGMVIESLPTGISRIGKFEAFRRQEYFCSCTSFLYGNLPSNKNQCWRSTLRINSVDFSDAGVYQFYAGNFIGTYQRMYDSYVTTGTLTPPQPASPTGFNPFTSTLGPPPPVTTTIPLPPPTTSARPASVKTSGPPLSTTTTGTAPVTTTVAPPPVTTTPTSLGPKTSPSIPTTAKPACNLATLSTDYVFALDASMLAGKTTYLQQINVVSRLADLYKNLGPSANQIAMLSYDVNAIPWIMLGDFSNVTSFQSTLQSIGAFYTGGNGHNVFSALDTVKNTITQQSTGFRPKNKHQLFLFASALNTGADPLPDAQILMKQFGFQIYAIGLGSKVDLPSLQQITGNSQNVFWAQNLNSSDYANMLSFITSANCALSP